MRKSIVLVVVMGVLVVLTTLALAGLYFMSNQARVGEHKVWRTKAFYTAQAVIANITDRLDKYEPAADIAADILANFKMNNLTVSQVDIIAAADDPVNCTPANPGQTHCINVEIAY